LLGWVITGGTGVFEGDTGYAALTGTITLTSPTTGVSSGTYAGALTAVPEPATFAILGAGIIGLAAMRRRRKAKPKLSVA
jgi:uncharacterized membrane protein